MASVSQPGVTQNADFELANLGFSIGPAAPGTVQITRGTPATIMLSVGTNPPGVTLGQSVSLTCGVPAGLLDTSCSLSPLTLQVGHSGASATLTINTTAGSRATPLRYRPGLWPTSLPWQLAAVLLAAMILFFCAAAQEMHYRKLPALLTLSLLATVAVGLVSCSGGSSPSSASVPAPPAGTPAGASTVNVTASGDGITETFAIPINVN